MYANLNHKKIVDNYPSPPQLFLLFTVLPRASSINPPPLPPTGGALAPLIDSFCTGGIQCATLYKLPRTLYLLACKSLLPGSSREVQETCNAFVGKLLELMHLPAIYFALRHCCDNALYVTFTRTHMYVFRQCDGLAVDNA